MKVHCVNHMPDQAEVLVDKLIISMKEELRANPVLSVGIVIKTNIYNIMFYG